jgi:toxin CptA
MNLTPLVIVLKPSRMLAVILLIAHAVSGVLIMILPLALWLKLVGIAIIVLASFYYVRRYALLRTPTAVRELRMLSDGRLEIFQSDWQSAKLVGEQFIHPMLTIIRCRTETDRWPVSIVILSDMLDAESFRALRVRLKWRR